LDRDERKQRSRSRAAELLVEEQPEQLVVAEQLDNVPRELVRRVDLSRARSDPLTRELPHEVAKLALLVGQRVVRHAEILVARGQLLVGQKLATASMTTIRRAIRNQVTVPSTVEGGPRLRDCRHVTVVLQPGDRVMGSR